ncbi:Cysteine proteinase 2 [Armadillidium nasatum]|uniref:Cysteine proteinase 2 n=1 Tax=Armadillidium nasatum TaxID=96803 RepID=A0A5N5SJX9_9CRUS|nr:Cysteine proteinase 2 [Armadillidium nasatum]
MKEIFFIVIMIAFASAKVNIDSEWEFYKEKFNKRYSPEEDTQRYKIFQQNKLKIAEHNKRFEEGKETFKMGINQFADKIPEEPHLLNEFKKHTGENKKGARVHKTRPGYSYPKSVDWRESGCISGVKDQGQCGSPWTFVVSESLEAACCLKNGYLVSLSTQNLIDCVEGASCSGGVMNDPAFDYIESSGGLDTEASYPFTGQQGVCHFDPANIGCPCSGYVSIPSGSEDDLLTAVATAGPVTAAIDASRVSFQLYASGVYYDASCSSVILGHSVLIVGYGTENSAEFWLVKNSWGVSWGENGYIKMARNRDNNCGIASDAAYPLV